MKKSVFTLAHKDLDGMASVIISNPDDYYLCSYDYIKNGLSYLEDWIHHNNENSIVYISDILLQKDVEDIVVSIVRDNPKIKFYYFDHHINEDQLVLNYSNFLEIKDISRSSCKIMYDYLVENGINLDIYSKFILSVNDYDLWNKDGKYFKEGLIFNYLCYSNNSAYFISKLIKSPKISTRDIELYNNMLEEKKTYFNRLLDRSLIYTSDTSVLSVADKFVQYIYLDFPSRDVYINLSGNKLTVRFSKECNNNKISKIKEAILGLNKHEKYGGHERILVLTVNLPSQELFDLLKQSFVISNQTL